MADPTPTATRGEPTREALLRAAIDVFGRDGFDAASTRAISDAAGVNQALIGYHFGGKPGLYLAALRSIAASVSTRIGPLVESIEAQLEADGAARTGKKVAERSLAALQALLEAFVGMLASDDSAAWARLILREQQNPSDGFDVLYEGFMHRILGVASELVARAQNRGASAAQCKLVAFTILGQAIGFRAARAAVMREMQGRRLATMRYDEGDSVKRGDVVADLDAEPYREALAVAEARVEQAQANLAKFKAGTRPQEVERAKQAVTEAQAAYDNAIRDFKRQSGLVESGASSEKTLDTARTRRDETAAKLAQAKEALALAAEGFRAEDVAAAHAELSAAIAQRDLAQTQLDDTRLAAPSDGTLIARTREPGSMLAPGTSVYSLSLRDPLYVRAYVDEPSLGKLAPGTHVSVRTDSSTKTYTGQ